MYFIHMRKRDISEKKYKLNDNGYPIMLNQLHVSHMLLCGLSLQLGSQLITGVHCA